MLHHNSVMNDGVTPHAPGNPWGDKFYSRHARLAVLLSAISLAFFIIATTAGNTWVHSTTAPPIGGVPGAETAVLTNLFIDPAGGFWGRNNGEFCGDPNLIPAFESTMKRSCRLRHTALAFAIMACIFAALTLYWAIVQDDYRWVGARHSMPITLGFVIAGTMALISFATGYKAYQEYYSNVLNAGFDMDYGFSLMIAGWILCWIGALAYCCMKRTHDVFVDRNPHAANPHVVNPYAANNGAYVASSAPVVGPAPVLAPVSSAPVVGTAPVYNAPVYNAARPVATLG